MSKTNSLPDFLADLADGIRTAEGSTAPINPQDFRSRVEALPGGGSGGGESGAPIEVATLPTATADTVGKVYLNTTDGNYYVGKGGTDFRLGEPVGNKIYFDTTKEPLEYVEYANETILTLEKGTDEYALALLDVLAMQGVTGYGHAFVLGLANTTTMAIVGLAYVYCDVLNVAQFNQMIGSQFGVSIPAFGWLANVIDTSAVADYEVTTNNLVNWGYLAYGNDWYEMDMIAHSKYTNVISGQLGDEYEYNFSNSIRAGLFANCSCTKFIVGDRVTQIWELAFAQSDIDEIVLPDGLVTIGVGAFQACHLIESITIPAGIKYLLEDCFSANTLTGGYRAMNLRSVLFAENSQLEMLGAMAFYYCENLTNITLPDTVTSIGQGAFCNCSSLKSINIPEGVSRIYDHTFRSCSSLQSIELPANLTAIGKEAFQWCSSLQSVTIHATTPPSYGANAFNSCTALTAIYVPAESVEVYKAADGWSYYADIIQAKA